MCYHDLIPWVPDLPVAGCSYTPKQAVALVTLQPPAVFFIHREQRKPIPTAVIPYPAAARRSCRPTWLFPPDFFVLRAKKPRRHAERGAARKNSMTKKPISEKPLAKTAEM